MTTLLCATLLAIQSATAPAPPPSDAEIRKELAAAAAKLVAAANYTTVYDDGSAAAAAADPHVGESPDPTAKGSGRHKKTSLWTIQWQKEGPTHLTRGRAEFWRTGKKYIALGRADEWVEVELPDPKQHAELRGMTRIAFDLDRLQLPHVLLNGVDRKLAHVTRSERDGKVLFEGALDPRLARQMLGGGAKPPEGREPGPSEPPRDEKPAAPAEPAAPPKPGSPAQSDPSSEKAAPEPAGPEYSGKLRVVVAAGVVEAVELELALRGTPEPRQSKRRFDVTEIGTTKFDVPAPASKLLRAQ